MQPTETPFMVVLRAGLPQDDLAHLFPVVQLMSVRETVAAVIWCSEIDESHFFYLNMTARLVDGTDFTHVKIPHQMVLAIAGSIKDKNPVGFVWGPEFSPRRAE